MFVDEDLGSDFGDIASVAAAAEEAGYDALWAAETGHDPFTSLALATTATSSIQLGTGIAVAFGRSPMITATCANDLQILSRGRLLLGLGSQIKPHIEKRYSMPWSKPAARMREYVLAMRAIWASWHEGEKLAFRGEFYRHTLMTPFFNPGPNPYGPPKVLLAAVGERMTEVAGEVADGLLVHPFTTERYVREVTVPAMTRGLTLSARTRADVQMSLSGLVATGIDDESMGKARRRVREQIAFYGSTPAYLPVLELHGWHDLHVTLNELSRRGEWTQMGELIDDEVLDTFAVVAPLEDVATEIRRRFGDLIDRFSLYVPYQLDADARRYIVDDLRA